MSDVATLHIKHEGEYSPLTVFAIPYLGVENGKLYSDHVWDHNGQLYVDRRYIDPMECMKALKLYMEQRG
jgi:hypothetical protein